MKKWFYLSIAALFISSATILIMPFASFQQEGFQSVLAYILAAMFWVFFALGFVFQIPVSKRRKADRSYKSWRRIGLLRFFSNMIAIVFDVMLIAGMITIALSQSVFRGTFPHWVTLAGSFAMVFGGEMHCIFNGRNYGYLKKGE